MVFGERNTGGTAGAIGRCAGVVLAFFHPLAGLAIPIQTAIVIVIVGADAGGSTGRIGWTGYQIALGPPVKSIVTIETFTVATLDEGAG